MDKSVETENILDNEIKDEVQLNINNLINKYPRLKAIANKYTNLDWSTKEVLEELKIQIEINELTKDKPELKKS